MSAPKGGNSGSFKKGKSGNPGGKPKHALKLTPYIEEYLFEIDKRTKLPNYKVIAKKICEKAKKGDILALKYIYDRIDGKPRETLGIEGTGNNIPIKFIVE